MRLIVLISIESTKKKDANIFAKKVLMKMNGGRNVLDSGKRSRHRSVEKDVIAEVC